MVTKNYSKTGRSCRVTFKLTPETDTSSAAVLGEFNSWNDTSHPMKKRKDGSFSTTVSLETGREYRFRYLLDGERWVNELEPDSEVINRYGTKDCVLEV